MNIEPALKALAAALHGEGPAVELSAGPDGEPVVTPVPTPGFEDAVAVVRTSGSTGTPKATVLTVDALAASSMATAFALKGEGQWLLALPLQYVAGVQVLVRSLFAGTRPWAMDLSGGFTAEGFTAAALELTDNIRFTSLVPTQLQRLLASPSADTLAVLRRLTASCLAAPRPLRSFSSPLATPASGWSPLMARRKPAAAACTTAIHSRAWPCGSPKTAGSTWAGPPSRPATWARRGRRPKPS